MSRPKSRVGSARKANEGSGTRIAALDLENARLRAAPTPAAAPASAQPSAAFLRDLMFALFEQYETSRGISADAYCETPQWHAMAEAQYLEAVVAAHSTRLLSDAQAGQRATASVARLQDGALRREAGAFAQWGLGFLWRDCPVDEPHLITTALVTRALAGAAGLVPSADLAREGVAGMDRLPKREIRLGARRAMVPVYTETLTETVENTVGVWAEVVLGHQGLLNPAPGTVADAGLVLDWLADRFTPSLGWAYAGNRPVFDLVHQVYIVEALMQGGNLPELEARALETFASFRAGTGFIDSMRLVDRVAAILAAERSGAVYPMFRGDHVLTANTKPARLWSLGALLGCFGKLALDGSEPGYWLSQIRRFPVQMLPDRFGADFRQEMHLARGAALALKALREQARAPGSQGT